MNFILQLLNEAVYDMKYSADQGGCYPPRPKGAMTETEVAGKSCLGHCLRKSCCCMFYCCSAMSS